MKVSNPFRNHCNSFRERNKDNLWFIQQYLKTELMYNYSIINNMFIIFDLDKFDIINNNDEKKEIKFDNLIYRKNKNHKKKKNNQNRQTFILDKESNIVYHNDKYYGNYEVKHLDKNDVFYDKTKLLSSFRIYNDNEIKFIVYPQIQKYQVIQSVFEDYEEITITENNHLASRLDKELTSIKEFIQKSIISYQKGHKMMEDTDEIIEHYNIKNKIVNISNELYYSNLDFNKNIYNLIDKYLYVIKGINNKNGE